MNEKIIKVTDRLRGLCSRREYCVDDVRQKALKALEGDAEAAAEVVETLIKDKYVDDLRYASAFARDKASIQGWGEVKIRYMLSAKRISREVIDQALAEIDADRASSKLFKLLETKYKSLRDDPQCRLKLLRFALGRGYGYDDASAVISQLIKS
jgi:regulatory protein